MRKIVHGDRLAIRVDEHTLLAVPPMPPGTPGAVRVKVFEYVLRRQPGLAELTAQIAADAAAQREQHVPGLDALISQAPYHTPRAVA